FSLFNKRDEFKLVILDNESTVHFITCDQPVLNVHAAGDLGNKVTNEVELYYPISPARSVLITNDIRYADKSGYPQGNIGVSYYNDLVVMSAFEQVFSKTKECVSPIRPFAKV
ncbi:MAG TPA: DUF4238 domain-containing protein, partial [Mariprofundaceae bacterium]|nr:DUF4238 domain-containing protein [Mariprofundaceae bacterium]